MLELELKTDLENNFGLVKIAGNTKPTVRLPKILISGATSLRGCLLGFKKNLKKENTIFESHMEGDSLIITFHNPMCRDFFLKKFGYDQESIAINEKKINYFII